MYVKTNNGRPQLPWIPVGRAHAGRPVRFESKFHQDCKEEDVYMVLDTCDSYLPSDGTFHGRRTNVVGVVNIRTGKLSFVNAMRHVLVLQGTTHIEDMRWPA